LLTVNENGNENYLLAVKDEDPSLLTANENENLSSSFLTTYIVSKHIIMVVCFDPLNLIVHTNRHIENYNMEVCISGVENSTEIKQIYLYVFIYKQMSTVNWRAKNTRTGCQAFCFRTPPPYVPNTLTRSTFSTEGSSTWTAPAYVTSVEYLIVGGGGGGGGAYDTGSAGGGGGGLALTGTTSVVPGQTYNIVVGAGGVAGLGTFIGGNRGETSGGSGGDSSFTSIVAGGGGGGNRSRVVVTNVGFGGSAATGLTPPTGGNGAGSRVGGEDGGGGGGNTTAGGSSTTTPTQSRIGGAGLTSSISGSAIVYGAGGTGGIVDGSTTGASAAINTGNGGGGATSVSSDYKSGGAGGSGIVILKYLV
jgi:hypothetical protein